jgi:hypothetical protein
MSQFEMNFSGGVNLDCKKESEEPDRYMILE